MTEADGTPMTEADGGGDTPMAEPPAPPSQPVDSAKKRAMEAWYAKQARKQEGCFVCKEGVADDGFIQLNCGHRLHAACSDEWAATGESVWCIDDAR
jgi:hypothetical protein